MYKEKNCARFLDLRLVDLNLNCSRLACGKSKMLFILATSQSSTFNFDKCERLPLAVILGLPAIQFGEFLRLNI